MFGRLILSFLRGLTSVDQISSAVEAAKIQNTNLVPTRVRWHVVTLLAIMAGLTYIDRLNLGIAGKYVQEEFKFDSQTMGWIFGAFSLGYAVFHLPGGWLADRFGPRRVLTGAILCFSIFTAVTAIAVTAVKDRKSTRLNSSHVRISYAVLCLQKKK